MSDRDALLARAHDLYCPVTGLPDLYAGISVTCACDAIRQARADEDERIAQAIEAKRDHFAQITRTPANHPMCLLYDDAARIARNGGRDGSR